MRARKKLRLGGIDAVLEAGEGVAAVVIDGATEVVVVGVEGAGTGVGAVFPELGFGAAETAEHPFGMDEDVDEGAFGWADGLVVGVVVGGEGVEVCLLFAADDFSFGVDAGFAAKKRRRQKATACPTSTSSMGVCGVN